MDFLLAMRVFVRVVECGGMSAAGRDLGLGQPAISERLRQLESHLGARLLDRNTRSVNVTDVGAMFYERAKQAVAAAEDAAATVDTFHGKLRGTLRIAAPHGIGETVLSVLIAELRRQHPELSIDLILNDRFVDSIIEGVDVSVRVGAIVDSTFIARPLGYIQRLMLASPAYLAQTKFPITPESLAAHPFIHIDGLVKGSKIQLIGPDGSHVAVPIRSAWRCNHWRPLLTALLAGTGIGVLQIPVCKEVIESRQLVPVLTSYNFPALPVHAIYPALRRTPAKTMAVINWLQTRMPILLADAQPSSLG